MICCSIASNFKKQVDKWKANPFNPNVIARMRKSAYMKNVVMKYLDNLFAWAINYLGGILLKVSTKRQTSIYSPRKFQERPQNIPPRAKHDETKCDWSYNVEYSLSELLIHVCLIHFILFYYSSLSFKIQILRCSIIMLDDIYVLVIPRDTGKEELNFNL